MVRVAGEQRAGRHSIFLAGDEDDVLVIVEAVEVHSSGAQPCAEMTQGGSESSSAHALAGMIKTSISMLHETDRVSGRETSSCASQLTDRGGGCRGLPPVSQGRAALRRTRDESLDTALGLPLPLALRGFGETRRNHATEPMLWGAWGKV